jgi:murein DD-endopeptidase MepM/ murein hydrolase activator NlpD
MGQYCSATWSDGGWAFSSHTALDGDPCAGLLGGTIRHAGMYSVNGMNNVVERCTDGRIMLFAEAGQKPLTDAFDDALGHPGCTFAVSPWEFPVFASPFSLAPLPGGYAHGTGFDFARDPYKTIDLLHDFKIAGGSTAAHVLDYQGDDKDGSGFIDDHQGHDFVMNDGTTIRAVADGVVDMARARDVSAGSSGCQNNGKQREVYIRHRFSGGKSRYDEVYESYYAHMESLAVSTGQIVHKGDIIGWSGHTGCTGGTPHMHMSVFRLSNTASALSYPLTINTDFLTAGADFNSDLGWQILVDPYGFFPPTSSAFDPWAWRGYDASASCYLWGGIPTPCVFGAQSTDLWVPGQEPPLSPHAGWAVEW